MLMTRILIAMLVFPLALLTGASALQAADCEDTVGRHMVGEALLAAHFVALAEKAGMTRDAINTILKSVAERSAIQEFWITDSAGHAYLTNTGVDFTFSPDAAKEPQASAFWPLLNGSKDVVIQGARKREIDDQIFKYVGVAGASTKLESYKSALPPQTCANSSESIFYSTIWLLGQKGHCNSPEPCPLNPRKQTLGGGERMSAKGQ